MDGRSEGAAAARHTSGAGASCYAVVVFVPADTIAYDADAAKSAASSSKVLRVKHPGQVSLLTDVAQRRAKLQLRFGRVHDGEKPLPRAFKVVLQIELSTRINDIKSYVIRTWIGRYQQKKC